MSVAKVSEIIASSKNSFDDALRRGIKRANKTIKNVKSAWVKDQYVEIKNGKIDEYRVVLMITFILDDQYSGKILNKTLLGILLTLYTIREQLRCYVLSHALNAQNI